MQPAIRALVLAVWAAVFPAGYRAPEAPFVADAIAAAVAEDFEVEGREPVFGSARDDAARMAVDAFAESGVRTNPRCFSWDCRAKVSCGVWQEPCAFVSAHALLDQARFWYSKMRTGKRECPADPGAPYCGGCAVPLARLHSEHRAWLARRALAGIDALAYAEGL